MYCPILPSYYKYTYAPLATNYPVRPLNIAAVFNKDYCSVDYVQDVPPSLFYTYREFVLSNFFIKMCPYVFLLTECFLVCKKLAIPIIYVSTGCPILLARSELLIGQGYGATFMYVHISYDNHIYELVKVIIIIINTTVIFAMAFQLRSSNRLGAGSTKRPEVSCPTSLLNQWRRRRRILG